MNKLRILPLAFLCGFLPSGHKEPRATKLTKWLITLLLLWPAFASAACLPSQVCWVTSGTAVTGGPCPDNNLDCAPFNFAGRDFSASGMVTDAAGTGHLPYSLIFSFDSDPFVESFGNSNTCCNLQFELTVKGVPWGIPAGGDAGVVFFADLGIPAPRGTYSVPFGFEGFFQGAPEPFPAGLGCDVLNCVNLEFRGAGIVTFDVLDSGVPGWFAVGQQTFTFAAVPEPATLSLFALGLVGVGFMRRRKAIVP